MGERTSPDGTSSTALGCGIRKKDQAVNQKSYLETGTNKHKIPITILLRQCTLEIFTELFLCR